MSMSYTFVATGRISINNQVIACPECRSDRNIRLTTGNDCASVTGSCPSGHRWDEHRIPGIDVKRIAIQAAQAGS
jgi:hypothetical protein